MVANVPLYPDTASTYAYAVDHHLVFLLLVTGFFAGLIAVLIMTFSVKYRRRSGNEQPAAVHHGMQLELMWTFIPLAIALVIFAWGSRLYFTWARPPDDTMEVYVVGRQWMWKMQHAGGQREINQLHVPVGRPVRLTMISADVIHSFFVPEFRIHQDVIPGRYQTAWFQATKPGTYHLYCSQYCGTYHARMVGEVVVMEKEAFQAWLQQGGDGSMATEGRKLFQKLQCVSCHSADAKARAPVLENIYRTQVPLQDGTTVLADDNYLRESILRPDAKVVAGFQAIMPSYEGQVSEEEVLQLLAFIKGLGPGQTPSRTEAAEPPAVRPATKETKGKLP